MSKGGSRLSRLGVLAPVALSACIDASVLAAPAAGAIVSTVLKELSKAFMLKKWYHGAMSAREAEILLLQRGKSGSYLVRESQTSPGEYALSVRVRGRVRHVKIRREQNKYDIGTGEIFDDLSGLIEHCRAFPLTETSGEVLRLRQPVSEARGRPKNTQADLKTPIVQELKPKAEKKIKAMDPNVPKLPAADENAPGTSNEASDSLSSHEDFDDSFLLCYDEFEKLKHMDDEIWFSKIEGRKPENVFKNRHRSILPFDQTRVKIPRNIFSLADCHTDYINASYIRPKDMFDPIKKALTQARLSQASHGTGGDANVSQAASIVQASTLFSSVIPEAGGKLEDFAGMCTNVLSVGEYVPNKFYIAAQGSLVYTRHSFWAAVVCNDVRVIAMLTQEQDHITNKCDDYWPKLSEQEWYGDLAVTTVNECSYNCFKVRFIEIFNKATQKSTTVYQYNYLNWPDHSIPEDIASILQFIEEVNSIMFLIAEQVDAPKENILWVHCSAGVGRTGTFIAVDMLLERIKYQMRHGKEISNADVFSTVHLLRWQRPGMVQNRIQFNFIYEILNAFIQSCSN